MEKSEYSIDYLSAARSDIAGIISNFVMLGSTNGAQRIRKKIVKAGEQIQFMPYSGTVVPDGEMAKNGYRMVVIEKYLMFYKVLEKSKMVIVYRVLDGRTDYPKLFETE